MAFRIALSKPTKDSSIETANYDPNKPHGCSSTSICQVKLYAALEKLQIKIYKDKRGLNQMSISLRNCHTMGRDRLLNG